MTLAKTMRREKKSQTDQTDRQTGRQTYRQTDRKRNCDSSSVGFFSDSQFYYTVHKLTKDVLLTLK